MTIAIIAFIAALLILVVAHEWGHYILAKLAGVKVFEFAAGMGKKVLTLGRDKSGTVFNLRAFPIGGFVRIKGESMHEAGALTAKDSFLCAPFRWKVAILLGGIVMNILVAWLFFTLAFWHGVRPIQVQPENISKVATESYLMPSYTFLKERGLIPEIVDADPARIIKISEIGLGAKLGLKEGDVITRVNEQPVNGESIQKVLHENIGKEIRLLVMRGSKEEKFSTICPEDECLLSVMLEVKHEITIEPIKFPLFISMRVAAGEVIAQSQMLRHGLLGIFSRLFSGNGGQALEKLSGPVGAARFGQFVLASGGWVQFLAFAGMLSMALAMFNLLPIPALDGGRLLGVVIQKVGKFNRAKYFEIEGYINTVFFIVLMVLGVVIMLHDLVRARGLRIPGF